MINIEDVGIDNLREAYEECMRLKDNILPSILDGDMTLFAQSYPVWYMKGLYHSTYSLLDAVSTSRYGHNLWQQKSPLFGAGFL